MFYVIYVMNILCTFRISVSWVWYIKTFIYIYIVLFGPVKPELGVIPSGQENHSKAEHLNFPGNVQSRMEINL